MDDFVLNVRQIGQYPLATSVNAADVLLMQQNGLGGAAGTYASIKPLDLFNSTFLSQPVLTFASGATLTWNGTAFVFSKQVNAPILNGDQVLVGGLPVATQAMLTEGFDAIVNNVVLSFNGRHGNIQLLDTDILRAGGVLATNPHFNGTVTAPTIWNPEDCTDAVATTAFVQSAICHTLESGHVVLTYNGRGGRVVPIADDVTQALTVFGEWGLANTPPSGDVSKRIANTAFVDDALAVLSDELRHDFSLIADALDQKYAPLDSPQFVGIPTGPTAAQTVNSGQLATTAFVHAAVTASTTGVSSFNTRTGAVVLTTADVTGAGGAPLNSPPFTGIPTVPLRALHDNTTAIASTAFVAAEIAALTAGVTSFNTRTGAVTLTTADVQAVGGAPIASPNFTGSPTAPTAAPGNNTTALATTAFVTAAISALAAPVTSFNGRTGAINFQASDISAVNGALLASPGFTGVPTAPTATLGTSNTQIATTAFVQAAVSAVVSGVSSFNGRSGAVTLTGADLTSAGGALLAGPTFTGVPSAPTPALGTNSTQLATTAYVQAALAAAPGGVSSFNGRTGAITFLASDVSAVGGALLASPAFSGNPTAPTPAPGDADTSIATTAFVATAIAAGGGVTSFNGRAGVVTLSLSDVTGAGGAPLASPALTGSPTAPTLAPGTNTTGLATTAFVQANAAALMSGNRVLLARQTVSTPVASVDFPNVFADQAYDEYEIVVGGYMIDAGVAQSFLAIRYSNDGSTFDVGANYGNTWATSYQTAGGSGFGGNATTYGIAAFEIATGNAAVVGSAWISLWRPWEVSRYKGAASRGIGWGASGMGSSVTAINYPVTTAAAVGIRFLQANGGSFSAGVFSIYGIKK